MIEVATWPSDLSCWDPDRQPFYLELYGETSPLLDASYAETVPAGADGVQATADAPVYEYWWTLGHPGAPEHRDHWGPFRDLGADKKYPWEDLADPAARIYLYFPISGGWRAKEILATLKYLSPTPDQHSWLQQAGKDVQAVQPLLGGASQVAGLVPGGAAASKWLQTLSKLQVSSVPQTDGFNWSIAKMTFGSKHGVMQGVAWTLPRTVFQRLGGRITGSLAVSLIPAARQGSDRSPLPLNALAHAVVYDSDGRKHWVPDEPPEGHGFVELQISPREAAP